MLKITNASTFLARLTISNCKITKIEKTRWGQRAACCSSLVRLQRGCLGSHQSPGLSQHNRLKAWPLAIASLPKPQTLMTEQRKTIIAASHYHFLQLLSLSPCRLLYSWPVFMFLLFSIFLLLNPSLLPIFHDFSLSFHVLFFCCSSTAHMFLRYDLLSTSSMRSGPDISQQNSSNFRQSLFFILTQGLIPEFAFFIPFLSEFSLKSSQLPLTPLFQYASMFLKFSGRSSLSHSATSLHFSLPDTKSNRGFALGAATCSWRRVGQ